MIRSFCRYCVGVILILMMNNCANIGTPTGGIKDEIPPKVVESTPEENAVGYNEQEMAIKFDEIVVLKDLNDNFLMSPPQQHKPEVKAYGKEIDVRFEDSLQSNTVYTLYFGNAIVDNNEGNPLPNYTFSFSTGDHIDSMRIQGYVIDSYTLDREDGVIVGIYSNEEDSAFINNVPLRIAKTNAEGYFSINNVKPGKYIVRAISDLNRNYRFDQPGEKIAFLDEKVETSSGVITVMDSVFRDSIGENEKDVFPIFVEMKPRDTLVYYPDSIILKTFQEYHPYQILKEKKREQENRLDYTFADKIQETPKIRLQDDESREDWYISEYSQDSLTVSYWIRDTALTHKDTVAVIFDYQVTDTAEQYVWKSDTLNMRFKHRTFTTRSERKKEKKDKKKGKVITHSVLKLGLSIKGAVNYFDDVFMTSPQPLDTIDEAAIRLYEQVNDSTKRQIKFDFSKEKGKARTYRIAYKWDQDLKYQLVIDSASIYDIYGAVNDSIGKNFSVVGEDKFSTIYLNLLNIKGVAIVQMMDESQKIIETQRVTKDCEIGFFYLKPGKYYFALFYDENDNGKWDVGNYLEKRQAEERCFFSKVIDAKAYYEMEENWDLGATPILEQKPKSLKTKKKK